MSLVGLFGAGFLLLSCSENDPVLFEQAFVYIQDKNGMTSSEIPWDSNDNLVTYYVYLVCPGLFGDVSVNYQLNVGDGLTEGVDFRCVNSTSNSITFPQGIYKMPIRIEWLKHELDLDKDNSLTISLVSTDNDRVIIGKPGPDRLCSNYKIIKK